jgi:SAM-dependent methyltransferase
MASAGGRIQAAVAGLATRWRGRQTDADRGLLTAEKRVRALEKKVRELERNVSVLPELVGLAGLRPHERVLDVGCGPGYVARDVAGFLSADGLYDGIDVQRGLIEELRERYARAPNFRFHHADIENATYNPTGAVSASDYRFPIADASVDVVVLRSVFTHMLPDEVARYVAEIARVLAPGGRAYVTYFLLNEESRPAVGSAQTGMRHPLFHVDRGDHVLKSAEAPADAVALDEALVRALYDRHGLEILEPVHYGSWTFTRRTAPRRQDVVVAAKRSGA